MSKSRIPQVVVLLMLGAGIMAWWGNTTATPAHAEDRGTDVAAQVQKLAERVSALEVAVIRDPNRPKDTVLARLDAVEERLKAMDKAGATDAKAEQRTFEDIRKAMEKTQKENEELERKLKALEQDRRGGDDDGAVSKEVKGLRTEMDKLARGLDDLKARVAKLEAKR